MRPTRLPTAPPRHADRQLVCAMIITSLSFFFLACSTACFLTSKYLLGSSCLVQQYPSCCRMCHQQPQQMCPLSKFTQATVHLERRRWISRSMGPGNTTCTSGCCKIITKILLYQHYMQIVMNHFEAKLEASRCKKKIEPWQDRQWLQWPDAS